MWNALIETLRSEGGGASLFYKGEIILAGIILFGVWWLRPRSPESNFRVREADLKKSKSNPSTGLGPNQLADARMASRARPDPAKPLQLDGIRIDGAAHEVLGISSMATPAEIQKAYRELMKRYHPDKIGPPGSREWNDAQKIAEAINRAKDEMLKRNR